MTSDPDAAQAAPADPDAARRRRRDRRRDRRRAALLEHAAALLARGPDALTMAALAEAADLAPATLYHYVPGKDAVLLALAEDLVGQEADALAAAIPGPGDAVDALARVLRARAALYAPHPERFRLLYEGLSATPLPPDALAARIYPLAARVMAPLADRFLREQGKGRVAADLRPRVFVNVAFLAAQGILATTFAMERAGGSLLFPPATLLDELIATLRRAAAPP